MCGTYFKGVTKALDGLLELALLLEDQTQGVPAVRRPTSKGAGI